MIELFLLLIGARVVRRKWWILFCSDSAWMLLGFVIFADAMTDDRIPSIYFTIPLMIDAAISLIGAFGTSGTERSLRIGKAVLFIVHRVRRHRGTVARGHDRGLPRRHLHVHRCELARRQRLGGAVRAVAPVGGRRRLRVRYGHLVLLPWPTNWAGEVGADVGQLVSCPAAGLCGLGLRIRRLPRNMPMSAILTRGWPSETDEVPAPQAASTATKERVPGAVTVHVWTPTGALAPVGIRRYVVAFNEQGANCRRATPHSMRRPMSISATTRRPRSAARDLNSSRLCTPRRAMTWPARFSRPMPRKARTGAPRPSEVRLDGLDLRAIRAFWKAYRRDTTYNLTNRNCSSGVAKALDAGLEGMFEARARSPFFLMRLLFMPELWVAGVLRRRAAAMAWTPGIVLDYARALFPIIRLLQRLRP